MEYLSYHGAVLHDFSVGSDVVNALTLSQHIAIVQVDLKDSLSDSDMESVEPWLV